MKYCFTLTTILLFVSISARGASFSPPATLATSSLGGFVSSAAIDAGGDTLVAWQEDGPNDTLIPKARYRKAGGAWSAPVVIGPPSQLGQPPFVRFSASDGATAIMANGTNILETDMAPGGKWGKPKKILKTKEFALFVTDSNGDEAIVAGLQVTRRGRGKQTWSAPVAIPAPPSNNILAIDNAALGPDGDLLGRVDGIPAMHF
jgi:hypothetical protein